MKSRKIVAIERLADKVLTLAQGGAKCLHPERPNCCPCKHEGSDFIIDMATRKPMGCSCGKCPRLKCLDCKLPESATSDFCVAMRQLDMAEEFGT